MGLLFFAFSLTLVLAAWELGAWGLARLLPPLPALSIAGRVSAGFLLLVALVAGVYGFFEAKDLRVTTVPLATDKLPAGSQRLRIAQVSDLHLGLLLREPALAPVIARLRELQPDLLVVTGDMVDAQINHVDGLSDLWQQLKPPLGKFAVLGNHEVYAGLGQSLDFLRASGFTVLRNASLVAGDALNLVGVDDPATGQSADESALLAATRPGLYTILLKHRPALNPASLGHFDLQLSGHAHRGQIFPFNLLTGLRFPMQNGLYPLPGKSLLYASRGTGTWGPPMRLFSPPELTVFDITPRHR
jgi:predicted MPP superfamily phosphohydrolase